MLKTKLFISTIPDDLNQALLEFEKGFQYPLSKEVSFLISHGPDYLRFFKSLGEVVLAVSFYNEKVVGVCVGVKQKDVLGRYCFYLCDLKVLSEYREMSVAYLVSKKLYQWCRQFGINDFFAFVMGGTSKVSAFFRGRLDFPPLLIKHEYRVLRLDTEKRIVTHGTIDQSADYQPLFKFNNGKESSSNCMELIGPSFSGVLEDTLYGKKIMLNDGVELLSSHLSDIKFSQISDLVELLEEARVKSQKLKYPGLFVAIPERVYQQIRFNLFSLSNSKMTMFTNMDFTGLNGTINTAEV